LLRLPPVFALIVVAWLWTVPALAQASAPASGWGLSQLMQGFAAIKASSARFVERKYLHMLKEPIEDSGTLFYRAPDQLRKDTLRPQIEHLSIDHDLLAIEREGMSQTLRLDDYPQIWAIIEGIRGTLAGDQAALERYYRLNLEGRADAWQLSLEPRDPKIKQLIRSIRIFGSGAHINRIDTEESDGDRTEMTITEDAS
jgi:outer membrane lipoprotein-sorting protein